MCRKATELLKPFGYYNIKISVSSSSLGLSHLVVRVFLFLLDVVHYVVKTLL